MRTRQHLQLVNDQDGNELRQNGRHFYRVFTEHPYLYCFILVTITTLDSAQIANDWLFFKDVYRLDKGLVYGPLNAYILMLILLICGLGTLIFLFEILNLFYDVCSGKPWISIEVSFVITVWFQELPMITASFVITLCHNEPVSYFQLIKALLVMVSIPLKIIIPLIHKHVDKANAESTGKCKYISKGFLAAGLCLLMCGSVAIFIFTHVIATDERQFRFRLPDEIWAGKFAYDKYFTNVGIYFHHVNIENENVTSSDIWLKLAEIHDFFDNDYIHVKISYIEDNGKIQKLMLMGFNETSLMFTECYNQGVGGIKTSPHERCTPDFISNTENHERLAFKFYFIRPKPSLLLGNIVYNVKYLKDSVCWTVTSNETDIFYPQLKNGNYDKLGQLLYLKHQAIISNTQRLVHEKISRDSTPYFLQTTNHSLLTADDIWITGMYGCNCTGHKGPVMDSSMRVEC